LFAGERLNTSFTHAVLIDEIILPNLPFIWAKTSLFCNTMMTDGVKNKEKEAEVKVMDIAELITAAEDI
jgi:heterodisulfide reductase subunit D